MAIKYTDDVYMSGSLHLDEVTNDGNLGSTAGYSMVVINTSTSAIAMASIPSGGGGGTLQDVLDSGSIATNASMQISGSGTSLFDVFNKETGTVTLNTDNHIHLVAGGVLQLGNLTRVTDTDSSVIMVGTGTSGATYSFRAQNSDKTDYIEFSDAGRLQLYSGNSQPLIISRPNGNSIIQFRNDANEGSMTYYGNGAARWGTGVIQKSSTNFVYQISYANGNADLPSMQPSIQVNIDGSVDFLRYGSGTNTGTAAYMLGVTSAGLITEEAVVSVPNIETGVTSTTTNGSSLVTISHSLGFVPRGVSIQLISPQGLTTIVTSRTTTNVTVEFNTARGNTYANQSVEFSYILIP